MQKFTARILDTVVDEYFNYSVYAECQHDALIQCEKDWPNFPVQDLYISVELEE